LASACRHGWSCARDAAFFAGEHERCAADAVQLHGGTGILRGNKVERIFRESKIFSIGGGSTEAMKDLVARQLGMNF
jgi:alkylation response protein AidB-like acyl-CoA dehydrogenase